VSSVERPRSPPPDGAERKQLSENNKSQPPPDLREDRPSPQCLMLSPPSLPTGRDVGNDDEVLASTYNAIVPHKGSNVNVRFGSNQFIAALADVFGLDDAAPKCTWRVQFSRARDRFFPVEFSQNLRWFLSDQVNANVGIEQVFHSKMPSLICCSGCSRLSIKSSEN